MCPSTRPVRFYIPPRAAVAGLLLLACLCAAAGCAITWRDRATGARHLLGFMHLTEPPPPAPSGPADPPATFHTLRALGLILALDEAEASLTIGAIERRRLELRAPHALITLAPEDTSGAPGGDPEHPHADDDPSPPP